MSWLQSIVRALADAIISALAALARRDTPAVTGQGPDGLRARVLAVLRARMRQPRGPRPPQ
jgi:hypothetical protein